MRAAWLGVVVAVACAVPGWGQPATVFYDGFETGDTSAWRAPARVGETGQTTCYDAAGAVIACAGTGQDGDKRGGVAWPNPRFTDNGDGTTTDNLTGLVWLRYASCADLAGTDTFGRGTWTTALSAAAVLASGTCGLTDGSAAGDWRLPSRLELERLLDLQFVHPAVSDAAGTARWGLVPANDAFSGILPTYYWTSTSRVQNPAHAWYVLLDDGFVSATVKSTAFYVWPVRDGQ